MLSRYDVTSPLSPLFAMPSRQLASSMSRLLDDLETAFARPTSAARRAPRVALRDEGSGLSLVAELAGVSLDDVELAINGATVSLKASAKARPAPEGFTALRRERQPAALEWSFEAPYAIDAEQATATLEQGRLLVKLPKAPEAKPRNIPVKAG